MDLKKISNIGVLTAFSLVLMLVVKFPIIPAMPFLLYEPGDVPILLISFLYGPLPALAATGIASILMAVITGLGGPYGALMHFLATGTLVALAGFVYHRNPQKKRIPWALLIGSLAMTLIMIPANLFITPYYLGVKMEDIWPLLLPGIIPFNLLKSIINSLLTFLVYKKMAEFLKAKGLLKIKEVSN